MKTLLSIASARPNFVKLAAIHHAWKEKFQNDFKHVIVHTGQHYDPLFSDIFFEQLDIAAPDVHLGIHGGDREEMIQRTQEALLPVLKQKNPDVLLVYGDVNGALAAAQAAHELNIPIAHVEAGLRSGDLDMPEEHNRIGVDKLAEFLFCTEQAGIDHLKDEGVSGEPHLVGNTMIDTLMRMKPLIAQEKLPLNLSKQFGVVTLHRPSNVDEAGTLRGLIDFLNEVSEHLELVLPVHHRLKKSLESFDFRAHVSKRIKLVEPQGYVSFLHIIEESACILTDSGGIQEEAVLFQKRCFTLRRNTERPSTIEAGSNILIDPGNPVDRAQVLAYAKDPKPLTGIHIPEKWDGKAGERILDILKNS